MNTRYLAFVRVASGGISSFVIPGSGTPFDDGTSAESISNAGVVVDLTPTRAL